MQCLVLADAPDALAEFCGISILERLLRSLQRCGVERAIILSSTPDPIRGALAKRSWARAELQLNFRDRSSGPPTMEQIVDVWPNADQLLLIVRADSVIDPRLLQVMVAQRSSAVLVDSNVPAQIEPLVASATSTSRGKLCGLAVIERAWASNQHGPLQENLRSGLEDGVLAAVDVDLQPLYYVPMRRNLRPFWFPAPSILNKKLAERVFFDSIQKGTLDLPAFVHGPIETFLVSRLCRTKITPNELTIFTNVVAWIATILFATGHLVPGIVIALIVGVLDGLDGKQARVKVETTKRGKVEHWFDAFFEWSWWIALAWHFRISGELPGALWYLGLLAVAEAIDGIMKGVVYFRTGKLIDELGPFERTLRLIGGRRNIYVWTLATGLLLGAPGKAFAVMAWLQAFTAAAHLPRVAWALARGNLVRAN